MAGRSVVEVMVLAFTGLVVFTVLFGSVAVVVIEVLNPEADTSGAVQGLANIISGILGALLGMLAGRSEAVTK
jgi:hypothetical protein